MGVTTSLFFNEAFSDFGDSWLGVVARAELLLLVALFPVELLMLSVAEVRFMLFLLLLLAGGGYSWGARTNGFSVSWYLVESVWLVVPTFANCSTANQLLSSVTNNTTNGLRTI